MRFQKAIKRMIALGTGAVMLSSVAGSAFAAADLANYPAPFIKDGKFNGVLVVGDKAAAEDVIGVTEIGIALAQSAVKKVTSGGATETSVEGDAWQVATSNRLELSEELNTPASADSQYRENLRNVTTFIDKNNLKALASGEITNNKVTSPFNQYLHLLSSPDTFNTGYVQYTENDDNDVTGDFLYFKSGTQMFRYVLEFTTSLESDVDDSAGSSSSTGLFLTDYQDVDVTLLGKKYTIVTAKRTTTLGSNVVLTLMGGANKDTLVEKQTKSYSIGGKDYEVTLQFVDADEAQFVINGQTSRKMKDGDTDKLADGTTVGVTDILYQDYAGGIHSSTFFLGANKLELKDTLITDTGSSNALKVDDNTIDDASVFIEGSDTNSTFKITRLTVNMTADDNYFVPAGGKLSEAIKTAGGTSAEPQVLFTENWDVEYRGLKKVNTEAIKIKTSGSSQYNLEFMDGDGKKVDLPIAKAKAASIVLMGDQNKELINRENSTINKDDYFIVTDGSKKRGERKTYALQYKGSDKITADNPVLKFKNLGTGDTIEQTYSGTANADGQQLATLKIGGTDYKVFNANNASTPITGNDFDIRVDLDGSGAISGINDTFVNITTRYGAEIGIINMTSGGANADPNAIVVSIKTPDENRDGSAKDSVENVQATDYVLNLTADSSTKVALAVLNAVTSGQKGTRLAERTPDGKTNVQYAYTSYGAFITRDSPSSEPGFVAIEYPESQRYALVYITAKGTSFSESGSSTDSVTVQKIQVGAAKLASEVSDIKAVNSILVGGPCANAAARVVMGNPVDCTAGFTPGEGRIELFAQTGDNVAMLVAGYGAVDTRNAAAVVANYADYKASLKGTKVTVKKVNNQLTVVA